MLVSLLVGRLDVDRVIRSPTTINARNNLIRTTETNKPPQVLRQWISTMGFSKFAFTAWNSPTSLEESKIPAAAQHLNQNLLLLDRPKV